MINVQQYLPHSAAKQLLVLKWQRVLAFFCYSLAGLSTAGLVNAQESDSARPLEEIVVTATKRSTLLQETPIAIGILSGKDVRDQHIAGLGDVAKHAISFQVGDNSVVPSAVIITIRGLQSNTLIPSGDPGAAPHIDGIYTSRGSPRAGIFDVERIEILRGPQGTLFGRNSTSGAVNIITAKPEFEKTGYVSAGFGTDNFSELLGAISVPVAESFALRVAGFTRKHDGYQKNLNPGQPDMADDDSYGGRVSARWEPNENLAINASIDYVEISGAGANYQLLDANGLIQNDAHTANTSTPHMLRFKGGGERIEIVYSLDDVDLIGLFGHRYVEDFSQADIDGTPNSRNRAVFWNDQRSYFGEFRAQSSGDSDFSWTLGTNYYDDNLYTERPFTVDLGVPELEIRATYPGNTVKSYAVFGNGDFAVSQKLALTGGVRYTNDKKDFPDSTVVVTLILPDGTRVPQSTRSVANTPSFSKTTWTAGVNYLLSDEKLAYGKVSTGYKAGGSEQGITYLPENVTGYEAGLKTTLLNGQLTLNFAAFYNDYEDLQVAKTVNALTQVENAATATTKGLEVEAAYASANGFLINAGISFLNGEYGSYLDATDPRNPLTDEDRENGLVGPDLSGNDLPDAPQIDAILSIEKDIQIGAGILTPRIDLHHRSRYWGTEFNDFGDYGVLGQKAYTRIDAGLAYAFGQGWSIRAWGNNLTDEEIQTFAVIGGNGSMIASYDNPRNYGLNVSYDF